MRKLCRKKFIRDRKTRTQKSALAEYEAPALDPAIDEALQAYIRQRKESFPDSNI